MEIYDPMKEMRRLHEEMDRVFGSFFEPAKQLSGKGKELARSPVTGLRETEKSVIATFELPGASKDGIDINVTESSIEVRAEQKHEAEEKGKDFYGYSSVSKSFYRKLPLPAEVKTEGIDAEYKDGVLTVEMPKANGDATRKRIEIK